MDPGAREQHDLVAGIEPLAEDRLTARGDLSDGGPRELDLMLVHQFRQRGRLAAPPRAAGVDARVVPAIDELLVPVPVAEPIRLAGGEVGVYDERARADAAEIAQDRADRVVGHVPKTVDPELLGDGARDDRLCAQALEHLGEALTARRLEHERGLPAGGLIDPSPAALERSGGLERTQHGVALAAVEDRIVHPGFAVPLRALVVLVHGGWSLVRSRWAGPTARPLDQLRQPRTGLLERSLAARVEHDLEIEHARLEEIGRVHRGDRVRRYAPLTRPRGELEGGAPGRSLAAEVRVGDHERTRLVQRESRPQRLPLGCARVHLGWGLRVLAGMQANVVRARRRTGRARSRRPPAGRSAAA